MYPHGPAPQPAPLAPGTAQIPPVKHTSINQVISHASRSNRKRVGVTPVSRRPTVVHADPQPHGHKRIQDIAQLECIQRPASNVYHTRTNTKCTLYSLTQVQTGSGATMHGPHSQ